MLCHRTLITPLLAACGLLGVPVSQGSAPDPDTSLQEVKRTSLPGDQERHHRLIIKFKSDNNARASVQAAELQAREMMQGLGERAVATRSGQTVRLQHLKTIRGSVQVASTGVALTRADMQSLIAELAKNPSVEYAEIDERMRSHLTPNDTFFASQWNMQSAAGAAGGANFQQAWDRTIGASTPVNGAGVVVAVLDSGYRPHADLVANIVQGYDFVSADNPPANTIFKTANDGDGRDNDPLDPGDWNTISADCTVEDSSWHGTHVAGIVAAVGNNGTGVIGGAYGAKVLPVRVLGVCGGFSSDIQEGMYWAAGLRQVNGSVNPHVAKVINMSLGSVNACSTSYQDAINDVTAAGTTVVVSAGNDDGGPVTSPANCNGVIAVTSHTITGVKSGFANIGTPVALSAPGSSVFSTDNTGRTSPQADAILRKSGTSMAAPHVAAAAALLLQVQPSLTPAQVANFLKNNTRAFVAGSGCTTTTCGTGMLDAFQAVRALQVSLGNTSNTAPAMTSGTSYSGTAGAELQFTVTASDADGDTVTFSATGLPSGATLESAGRFRWTNPVQGSYSFNITPSDASRSGVAQTVTLTISAAAASGGGGGALMLWEMGVAALCLGLWGWTRRRVAS
jgi:serine protease